MGNRKPIITVMLAGLTALLFMSCGLALKADCAPLTPELAGKREMVRKQQEQRITNDKRKTASDALKAERRRIHNAKKAVKPSHEQKPPKGQ